MENEMYYTAKQIEMQEQLKKAFTAKNFSNWELVGVAYRIEPGRAIVTPGGRFVVVEHLGDHIKLSKDGKEYTFKKFDLYVPLGKGMGKVEYR